MTESRSRAGAARARVARPPLQERALHAEREPVTDHVQIGFHPGEDAAAAAVSDAQHQLTLRSEAVRYSPMESNWEVPPAVVTFTRDVEVVGLMPHMHVRGKAARFYVDRPDAKTETVLDVPRYDFNWQLSYDTSIKVLRGSKMRERLTKHLYAHPGRYPVVVRNLGLADPANPKLGDGESNRACSSLGIDKPASQSSDIAQFEAAGGSGRLY
jgi:hypothetical protein